MCRQQEEEEEEATSPSRLVRPLLLATLVINKRRSSIPTGSHDAPKKEGERKALHTGRNA